MAGIRFRKREPVSPGCMSAQGGSVSWQGGSELMVTR